MVNTAMTQFIQFIQTTELQSSHYITLLKSDILAICNSLQNRMNGSDLNVIHHPHLMINNDDSHMLITPLSQYKNILFMGLMKNEV